MPLDAATVSASASWRPSTSERTAAAFSLPADGWQQEMTERLARLLQFPRGWDGHEARPIRRSIVDYACGLLPRIICQGVPPPFVAPLPSGGLQLEWHRNGWDLEIEISAPGQIYAYARELATNDEWETTLTDDLSELLPKLAAISG